jgi:four helix bundle protein
MKTIKSFEDLEVWQLGRALRLQLYELSEQLPQQERYNLSPQIRRAAVSLTSNIAEGYGRFHFKENAQFCRISRGSAYELIDHLIACKDQGYLKEQTFEDLRKNLTRFVQMLNGYIRSIGGTSKD